MKSTGIVRNVDTLGRIVLPKELRRAFDISTDTPLEILTEGDTILLRKYKPAGACELCGEIPAKSVTLHGHIICEACRMALAKL